MTQAETVLGLDDSLAELEALWASAYPRGVEYGASVPVRSMGAMLDDAVARFGTRPAIDFLGKRYDWSQVGRITARLARGLQAEGIAKGDRVGLFLPNTPYYVFFYFALLKLGAIVVNANPLYTEQELQTLIADSGATYMVTLDLALTYSKMAAMLQKTSLKKVVVCPMASILPFPKNLLFPLLRQAELAEIPRDGRHLRFAELILNDGSFREPVIDPERDVAVLQYTGGTTGVPKGAMLTHANLTANSAQCRLWFPEVREGQEKVMAVIPFFHVFAMTVVLNFGVTCGAEIIMLPRFELDALLKAIHGKKPTLMPGVPTIYTAIGNHKDLARYDLRSLRYCLSGGAPLPVEVKEKFEALTGCILVEGYGLTETSPVATANPLDGRARTGSIGLPLPGTRIVLRDPTTRAPVRLGEKGEVCIAGPQVMTGYWNRPEDTAAVMHDGFLHTGDVGYVDPDGFIHLVDRIKDVVLCGGFNVYPRVVEEAIYQHPAVAETTVIGVPDEYRGETVKAFVVLQPGVGLTEEQLCAFLKERLSPIEMPKQIEFRDSLPKTMIGKLSKKELVAEEKARRAVAAKA